jgi:hypothetical protein
VIDEYDVEKVSPEVGPVIAIVGRVVSGPVLPPPVDPPSVGGGVDGGGVEPPPVVAFMTHENCCEAVSVPSLARAVTL